MHGLTELPVITCEHLTQGVCQKASDLVGFEVKAVEARCVKCLKAGGPDASMDNVASLAAHAAVMNPKQGKGALTKLLPHMKVTDGAGNRVAIEVRPRPKAKEHPPVSTIGQRVKKKLEWTGIPACQRCVALMNEMNGLSIEEVRARADEFAGRMLENLIKISNGEAKELGWWNQAKAIAFRIAGDDTVFNRAKAYIQSACDEEETEGQLPAASPDVRPARRVRAAAKTASRGPRAASGSADSTQAQARPRMDTPRESSLPESPSQGREPHRTDEA